MFTNTDISDSRRKLGVYRVGDKLYSNKYHAMENCPAGHYPHWDFNDDVFSTVDWTQEPATDLYELYRQRALQSRAKYDHVLIYYSGGIDSTCVLHSFIDNDIPIDGVILTGTWKIDAQDRMVTNQEQKIIGIPYLNRLQQRQKCPVHFLDTTDLYRNFTDPSWIYSVGQSFSPQVYTYNYYYQDPWVQDFLMRGSTCFVRGVDKPRVVYDSRTGRWQSGFLDTQVMSGTPSGFLSSRQDQCTRAVGHAWQDQTGQL